MKSGNVRKAVFVALVCTSACGHDDAPPPVEQTGASCNTAADCFPDIDAAALTGEVTCLGQVPGYCTHTCTKDEDCCAVTGECRSSFLQVCSPFENMQTPMYCFLSCEDALVADAGAASSDTFCSTYAHAGWTCRSTGGGMKNRKVCMGS
jgi:hypothetical protein